MSVEHAPPERRGFYGSVVALGLPIGIILSNAVFLAASLFVDPRTFLAWGWRSPFLASAVLVGVGLFIRVGLHESPVFADVHQRARERGGCRSSTFCAASGRTVLLAAGATPASARSATSCSSTTSRTRPASSDCR